MEEIVLWEGVFEIFERSIASTDPTGLFFYGPDGQQKANDTYKGVTGNSSTTNDTTNPEPPDFKSFLSKLWSGLLSGTKKTGNELPEEDVRAAFTKWIQNASIDLQPGAEELLVWMECLAISNNPRIPSQQEMDEFAAKAAQGEVIYAMLGYAALAAPDALPRIIDKLSTWKNTAGTLKTGKTFYRSMSQGEAEAVGKTGMLRGGRAGDTFFTDSRYRTATRAKDRLSLPNTPEVQMEFRVTNNPNMIRNGTRVDPKYGGFGKGKEFMTTDPVQVEIINVQPY